MTGRIFLRTGARMDEIPDDAASLIITGPPYWPLNAEQRMFHPPKNRQDSDGLVRELIGYALTHRAVFMDCHRILKPGGCLVLQTRDVRLRDRLVPLAGAHRQVAEFVGFDLYTRYLWETPRIEVDRMHEAKISTDRGRPRTVDYEEFFVFFKPGEPPIQGAPTDADIKALTSPIIKQSRGYLRVPHRWQGSLPVCELFIRAYSAPGDLVVDPFAGNGTTLLAAQRLGREAIGYDIDAACIDAAQANLEGKGHG